MKVISPRLALRYWCGLLLFPLAILCGFGAGPVRAFDLQALPPELRQQIGEEDLEGLTPEKIQSYQNFNPPRGGKQPANGNSSPPVPEAVKPEPREAPQGVKTSGLSRLERHYRQSYGSVLNDGLRQYGYELFEGVSAKPSMLAVPDASYILGPGDKLRIRVWGTGVDAEFTGTIGRDGTINVPKIGIVPVAGSRFGDVEEVIRREAEKYIQGININVALEELRSVEVYIVGSVANPGLHLVPAFSTVVDGLGAAGGIKKSGSMRKVELYRQQKLSRRIDLYDLLLAGDRKADIVLENRDVIFVPRLQETAAVAGSSTDEAIFELNGEQSIGALLDVAGGLLPQADAGRIHLRRYLENREFVIQDIDTSKTKGWRETPIRDGDLLELRSVQIRMPQTVRLEGHVWQADVFHHEPGLTLSRVLTSAELLKPDAVTDFALLHRYDPKTTRYRVQRFPLAQVLSGGFDLELLPRDRVEILSREQVGITEQVTVQGAVWQPGQFQHRPGLTLADALALAGGTKFGARVDQLELSRQEIEGGQAVTKHFSLALARDGAFPLQPYDYLLVPLVKDAVTVKTVTLTGEVKYPGAYRIGDGERLSDLIARAGGFLPEAYFFGARYTSEQARQIQQQSIDKMVRELELVAQRSLSEQAQTAVSEEAVQAAEVGQTSLQMLLNKIRAVKAEGRVAIKLADLATFRGSAYDFELRDGDALHIPKQPNFVATVGSVYSANAYLYQPNQSVSYYLGKSGGPTKSADEDHIYVLRANGEVISKEQGGRLFSRFASQKLMPGDTVVVPENLERVPHMRMVKDVADIVFKIATTAGIAFAI